MSQGEFYQPSTLPAEARIFEGVDSLHTLCLDVATSAGKSGSALQVHVDLVLLSLLALLDVEVDAVNEVMTAPEKAGKNKPETDLEC